MNRMNLACCVLGLAVALFGAASRAQSPNDDNGHHAFVRQALPHLLGRRPHNSAEVRVLADLMALRGREQVLRSLMQRPEFLRYWTETMADIMRAQRVGSGNYEPACMNAPSSLAGPGSTVAGDGGELAQFVATHPSGQFMAGAFNWYDVTYSSLELGSLVPAYRAYLYMRAHKGGGNSAGSRERSAQFFLTELLNRNVNCTGCHASQPQNEPGWDKQHPLHEAVDGDAGVHNSFASIAALFRGDLFVSGDNPSGYGPWGMSTACAELNNPGQSVASNVDLSVNFAGLSGDDVTVEDLADALMWGFDDLDATGMPLAESPSSGAAAFAYLLAAQVVNAVWENVMGEPLTMAHGYARNVHQRELHRFLLEDVFLAEQWSLQDLLTEILLVPEFNRRAPVNSARPTAYEVVAAFNPMLAEKPCDVEPTPAFDGPGTITHAGRDPQPARAGSLATAAGESQPGAMFAVADAGAEEPGAPAYQAVGILDPQAAAPVSGCTNGQGEIAHRHRPRTLLGMVAGALGWRQPQLFADADYPGESLVFELGQYLSRTRPGSKSVDFAGYLSWENAVGRCDGSGKLPPGSTGDWVSRLLTAQSAFDQANPENPVRLTDLVLALKDRILQRPRYGAFQPDDGESGFLGSGSKVVAVNGTGYGGPAEMELLAQFFGSGLNSEAAGLPLLAARLRTLCGVYLTSPEFMMTGIDTGEEHSSPRLTACLADEPCTYAAICNDFRAALPNPMGLVCQLDHVSETGGIQVAPSVPSLPPPPPPCLDCLKTPGTSPAAAPMAVKRSGPGHFATR